MDFTKLYLSFDVERHDEGQILSTIRWDWCFTIPSGFVLHGKRRPLIIVIQVYEVDLVVNTEGSIKVARELECK